MAIVQFSSRATGPFIMFEETAKDIFRIVDEPWLSEGAWGIEELPEVLTKLEAAEKLDMDRVRQAREAMEQELRACSYDEQLKRKEAGDEKAFEDRIKLYQRISPLKQMIKRAIEKGESVMWGKP